MAREYTKFETCCFSGYRPEKLPWGDRESDPRCRELKRRLFHVAEALYDSGRRRFVCGMARGCDIFFCESLLALRNIHKDVSIEAAIPCEEQAERWSKAWRERYEKLLEQCDSVTYTSRRYTRGCMMLRNRYMVDASSVIVTVYDGRTGGTRYTRDYAAKRGLEMIEIYPPE